jgi:hypothetical protein
VSLLTDPKPPIPVEAMVFTSPAWAGQLPPIPDNIPLSEFMLSEHHGRLSLDRSSNPFTCGVTGKTFSSREVVDRVDLISRALGRRLQWDAEAGNEWDRVLAIFSFNSVGHSCSSKVTRAYWTD